MCDKMNVAYYTGKTLLTISLLGDTTGIICRGICRVWWAQVGTPKAELILLDCLGGGGGGHAFWLQALVP